MDLTELEFDLGRLGLKLRRGQSVELVLLAGWSEEDTRRLWALLEATAGAGKHRLVRAGTLLERRVTWWDQLRGLTVAKAVAEALGWTREAARELCRRCHVEPESPLAKTSWTERKLIDFELATVSADLVVVDDTGCDPMGVRRFTAHIRNALSSHRFAVLGLNYPKVSSRGAWPQPWHDENWADVRLTVTHVV